MGFRLVPTSAMLNDLALNGVIAVILRYFTELDSFAGRLGANIKAVEDR